MKRVVLHCGLMLVALACGNSARADMIYDNLATDGTYASNDGWLVAGPVGNPISPDFASHSEDFTAGITASLTQVLVAMWQVAGSPSSEFDLALTDSSNNVLESWLGVLAPPQGNDVPVVVLNSLLNPILLSGQIYTLTATPSNEGTGDGWEFASNSLNPNLEQSGFRVLGDPANPVPEPGSLTLCLLGVASFGAMVWRKRRVAA